MMKTRKRLNKLYLRNVVVLENNSLELSTYINEYAVKIDSQINVSQMKQTDTTFNFSGWHLHTFHCNAECRARIGWWWINVALNNGVAGTAACSCMRITAAECRPGADTGNYCKAFHSELSCTERLCARLDTEQLL